MLKYRIQGSSNAIKRGIRIIQRSDRVEILSISKFIEERDYAHNKRVYVEVRTVPKIDERIKHENSEMCRKFFESKTAQFKERRDSNKGYW